jgi:hypothetical protein
MPIRDTELLSRAKFLNDKQLPICKKSITAIDDPKRDSPITDKALLRHPKFRSASELPRCR